QPDSEVPLPREIPTEPTPIQLSKVELISEDLRDGLHGTERYPSSDEMIPYLSQLHKFGISRATVGIYPGESFIVDQTIKTVLHDMRDNLPDMIPIVLCMTTEESLNWTIACKEINPQLEAIVFMG